MQHASDRLEGLFSAHLVIFGFGNDVLPDWKTQVCQHFPIVGQLATPHRWICVGEEAFGRWLLAMRPVLERGGSIDLSGGIPPNVTWVPWAGDGRDHPVRLAAGRCNAPGDEKVIIIADSTKPAQQRVYASRIPGAITVENLDLTDLTAFANNLDLRSANPVQQLVTFADSVMVNVGANDMIIGLAALRAGRARRAASNAETMALNFEAQPTYAAAGAVLAAISAEGAAFGLIDPLSYVVLTML